MKGKVKNAPLEASNVAVLLEHIPIGATRSIHSLQVKRVEADHYSIAGGPVIDLVDAVAQIGSYSGKHSNPNFKQHMAKLEEDLREARDALGVFKLSGDEEERAEFGLKALTKADLVLREASHVEHSGRATPMSAHSAAFKYRDEANEISNYIYPRLRKVLEKHAGELRSYPNPNKLGPQMKLKPGALQRYAAKIDAFDEEYGHWGYLPDSGSDADDLYDDLRHMAQHFDLTDHEQEVLQILIKRLRKYVDQEHNPGLPAKGAKQAYADVQYARSKKKGKKSNPHVEQRGYFYEVLNSAGNVVAMTTNKEEAQDVCDNPKQLGLPKSEYTFRHVGGKGLIPRTQAGNRARRVK